MTFKLVYIQNNDSFKDVKDDLCQALPLKTWIIYKTKKREFDDDYLYYEPWSGLAHPFPAHVIVTSNQEGKNTSCNFV